MLVEFNDLLINGNQGTFQANTISQDILNKKMENCNNLKELDLSNNKLGYSGIETLSNALKLKVGGILCPKEDNASLALTAGVHYTKDLTKYVIDEAVNTAIVQAQIRNKVDCFMEQS